MEILFTGATGVLGRASVPALVAAGHEVTALARSTEDSQWLESIGAQPWTGELFDRAAVAAAMSSIDTVVHYATSIPRQEAMAKREDWEGNDRLRADATRILVDSICVGRESNSARSTPPRPSSPWSLLVSLSTG